MRRKTLYILLPVCSLLFFIFLRGGVPADSDKYELFSSCDLPTRYGIMKFCVFRQASSGKEAIACVSPHTLTGTCRKNVPVRIHDACITSETFHSIKCDCQLQLDQALKQIATSGGLVVYLYQEGRGIGLGNKIAAYHLQETKGLDTVQANRALGLPDDTREYTPISDILTHFGIDTIALITNNPRKVNCLEKLGIQVESTIPCLVEPQSPQMQKYMSDKAEQMGHLIPIS